MELTGILHDVTGSGKSKMAVFKLVIVKSRPVYEIGPFQRLMLHLLRTKPQGEKLQDSTLNRKCKIQYGGFQTGSTHISASRWDRNEIPTAKSAFSRSSNRMGIVRILSDQNRKWDVQYGGLQTGSKKSKMAVSKPEISISQLPDEIETKFQRLNLHFRGPAIEWA